MIPTYEKLKALGRNNKLLQTISQLLDWDQETYMPKGSLSLRAEQRELLAQIQHEREIAPEIQLLLGKLIDLKTGEIQTKELDPIDQAGLREWRKDLLKAEKLPSAFIAKMAKTTSEAASAWDEAKQRDDFSLFAPKLEEILLLMREKSELIGYEDHPYDAHLEDYEPQMRVKILDPLFASLKKELKPLIEKASQKKPDCSFLKGPFEEDKVFSLCNQLLSEIQIDPQYSRLDRAPHPFCTGGHPHSLRLTTHREGGELLKNISACLHEGGHGLYELGLNPAYFGTPICDSISLGIHESQSRLWETMIGQSLPYSRHLLPHLQKAFPASFAHVSAEMLYNAICKVEPSFIRIYADEVTYIMHVILRYEIEKGLITGSIHVADLPEAWNALMKELLGVVPPTNRQGCLQDVHWSHGLFGYFPTYALGTLYAATWMRELEKHFPMSSLIEQGNFKPIVGWLRKEIHSHGRRFSATELCTRITGAPLSSEPFLSYIKRKYI